MFYPLWAGLATTEQAKAVARNLKGFEQPGGLPMSTQETGAQWDLPYGWGNIEMLAIEGLRRYGYNARSRIWLDQRRISGTAARTAKRDGGTAGKGTGPAATERKVTRCRSEGGQDTSASVLSSPPGLSPGVAPTWLATHAPMRFAASFIRWREAPRRYS